MTELIQIKEKDGLQAVSARELHRFLGTKERFSTWFERMIQYGLLENQDFTSVKTFTLVNNGAQRELDDYALTLDCAKHIAMVQRSEKGKQAREYFIECEKRLKRTNDEDLLLLNIIKAGSVEERALAVGDYRNKIVEPLKKELKTANKTIEHKVNVISYMTSDFKLQTQRQFLNEIIRMKGNANNLISERWELLYNFYEKQKHINLNARFEAYNNTHTPKLKSKLQLIDEVMNDIPTLYKVAVKTFEADFKDELEHYLSVL